MQAVRRPHAKGKPALARHETVGRRDREPTKEWRLTMRNFFKGLWQDESGAAAAEYALILAIVAVGISAAVGLLGTEINTAITAAKDAIANG